MTQHTPGPWTLKSWHEPTIVTREGDLIAMVYADKNRKLIAAAPDLLTALDRLAQAALARDNVIGDPCRLLEAKAELFTSAKNAAAAIAKARG